MRTEFLTIIDENYKYGKGENKQELRSIILK